MGMLGKAQNQFPDLPCITDDSMVLSYSDSSYMSLKELAERIRGYSHIPEYDTIPVILLVCDTSKSYGYYDYYGRIKWNYRYETRWQFGLEVREKHNTIEGVFDPYFSTCYDETGKKVDCYHDYWKHIKFLNEHGYEFPKNILIWDYKPINSKP